MDNLDIYEAEIAHMIDEKTAAKAREEFEKFFDCQNDIDETMEFFVKDKNSKRGTNKYAHVPKEIIKAMLLILEKIKHREAIIISGKKAMLSKKQAMQILDVSHERFNDMIKNKEIKLHKTKHLYYVLMEDIFKYEKKLYEKRGKLLKKLASVEW